jgi:hypothetical protein
MQNLLMQNSRQQKVISNDIKQSSAVLPGFRDPGIDNKKLFR